MFNAGNNKATDQEMERLLELSTNPEFLSQLDSFKEKKANQIKGEYKDKITALENDDLRTAAAIGLIYYDKLYDHTQQRYPREHNFAFDGKGISHVDIAEQLHALD